MCILFHFIKEINGHIFCLFNKEINKLNIAIKALCVCVGFYFALTLPSLITQLNYAIYLLLCMMKEKKNSQFSLILCSYDT